MWSPSHKSLSKFASICAEIHSNREAKKPVVKISQTAAEGVNEIWDNTKYMGGKWNDFVYQSIQT